MDDDVDAGPMRTPIWTLDTLTSNFGITHEMLNEVTLLHPDAQSWLRETSNTQNACVGGASINVRFLFSHLADNLQIRHVLPSSAERIAKSLLTTRGFVESCPPVVCVMKKVSYKSHLCPNLSRTFRRHSACIQNKYFWEVVQLANHCKFSLPAKDVAGSQCRPVVLYYSRLYYTVHILIRIAYSTPYRPVQTVQYKACT